MPNKLTDNHIDELEERGYVIVHDFLDEGQRQEIAAAVRKILKPWNEMSMTHRKDAGALVSSLFPNRYSTTLR
jgi:ectoine hydroxylase-related dioxygenase (phytanoyl-CoA dioxygenase family)